MTRQMLQPTKDVLRARLAESESEIIRLRSERINPPAIGLVFAAGVLAGLVLSWGAWWLG